MSYASVTRSSFIILTVSMKKNFEYFFENLPFLSPRHSIKLSDLDKSRMRRGGLLKKHFCKKSNIPNDFAEIINSHFSHYKSMRPISCHSNQSSYPIGIRTQLTCMHRLMSPLWFLRRFLTIFTKIDPFCRPDNQSNSPIFGQKSYET